MTMNTTPFIHDDFMLQSESARRLYHEYAEGMPIIDYHCHLSPAEVAQDRRWDNLSQIWLAGDHYKWRAMRANGVPEAFCTGDAPDREKFDKWAETVPMLLRNPLYHWTHLELARYFGIGDRLLNPESAQWTWDHCNEQLAGPEFSCRGLMKRSAVALVCTTDDPVDSLEYHRAIADDPAFDIPVLPTWRPDMAMAVEDPETFNAWTDRLAETAGVDVGDFSSFMAALGKRHSFFHDSGCRLSDHGIETVYAGDYTFTEIESAFSRIRSGKQLDQGAVLKFKSAMLYEFGAMDCEKGWTQQIHIGALRNNNTRLYEQLGPDTGFDSIGDGDMAHALSRLFDRLARQDRLGKTIVYNLNPRDNALIVSMLGNFQDGSVPGKMQFGSGWWFLDQQDGMERQMTDLSMLGLLSRFVGMTTDSRSFLSYPRHEYFRRILCNMLGRDMTYGLVPDDLEMVGEMVRDICYRNAATYFGFDLPA